MHKHVSIIIPTYNRAHLIGETLDSIKEQTYTNWECIVVDDGSDDNTDQLLKTYTKVDSRFRYLKRPKHLPKGANACRNIGLNIVKGEYVIFFDSDDLMTENHVQTKVRVIEESKLDFVIAQTRFFNHDASNIILEQHYNFKTNDISVHNYITHKINWLTYDVIIKSSLAKSVSYNESLLSGQEYNYYCKLILISSQAKFISDVLTLRRYHDNSIRGSLRKDKLEQDIGYLSVYWYTYNDVKTKAPKQSRKFLIYRCYRFLLKVSKENRLFEHEINKAILKEFGIKGVYYIFKLNLKRVL